MPTFTFLNCLGVFLNPLFWPRVGPRAGSFISTHKRSDIALRRKYLAPSRDGTFCSIWSLSHTKCRLLAASIHYIISVGYG
jgi:hypothetical protein